MNANTLYEVGDRVVRITGGYVVGRTGVIEEIATNG